MSDVYVIRNQHGHYWGKSKEWVSGSEAKAVMRVKHEDEAINTLFELSSKDIELRGEVVATALSEKGEPVVEPSQVPLPNLEPEPVEEAEQANHEQAVEAAPTTEH
ncbi:hypothetical protein BST95_17180 [Halioglobus japonicus]|uniref:hypothetical protein n=1 Tax=Halioglobus japonicus TaxID=930805 RepID=UPI0009796120|nr:hypothetical protein [Halioglobus japonicus]AQA19717.1 hypothetical protein BST95_17180 [Halioglobus japonicus]GHD09632.1 hypothetical protein GCM10007052_07980 [Halioglobus japonicus]